MNINTVDSLVDYATDLLSSVLLKNIDYSTGWVTERFNRQDNKTVNVFMYQPNRELGIAFMLNLDFEVRALTIHARVTKDIQTKSEDVDLPLEFDKVCREVAAVMANVTDVEDYFTEFSYAVLLR